MKNIFLCTAILSFAFSPLVGQEIITHPKRIYSSPDGNLYINKDLPLYFHISTSPDNTTESFLLQSKETSEYANPMYLDTEGFNTFRSPSAVDTVTKKIVYPLRDVIFEIYADSEAPKTKIAYGEVLTVIKDDKVYIGGLTSITLTCNDNHSGVQKLYYSLDSSAYKEYTEPIEFKEQGEYILQFYAVDNVGNMEDVTYNHLILDDENPATKLEIKGDSYSDILSARSSIELIASDEYGIKAINYSLDGGEEKIYKSSIKAAYISQGDHTLTYYSEDRLGNKEDLKTYNFYIDKTAPTIVEEIIGKSFIANGREFSSGRSKLKLTTFDNKSGVKEIYYSINDEEFQLYDKPFYLTNSSGSLRIKTYAVDNVNNKSTTEEQNNSSSIPYIDLSGPALNYKFIGPSFALKDTMFITKTTKISLRANDAESGLNRIEYRIDDGTKQEYSEPFTISEEGTHIVQYDGYDNVDNTNFGEFSFKVDTTGPEIFTRFSIPTNKQRIYNDSLKLDVYPSHVVLFLSATDSQIGVDKISYSIDGGKSTPYIGHIDGFEPEKHYQITIEVTDKLGNKNNETINFGIER